MSDRRYHIFTAGAAEPNPGALGVGLVILRGPGREEIARGGNQGTNIQASLLAVRRALQTPLAEPDAEVVVYSNLLPLVRALNGEAHLDAHAQLVEEVLALRQGSTVTFKHLPNAAGNRYQARAQELAQEATRWRPR